ncbi:hypothetical protein GGF31_007077 [Allomyces arbusculus]|nr:hypothetical protein GGF31_007077 [Allomyces arbusculus]
MSFPRNQLAAGAARLLGATVSILAVMGAVLEAYYWLDYLGAIDWARSKYQQLMAKIRNAVFGYLMPAGSLPQLVPLLQNSLPQQQARSRPKAMPSAAFPPAPPHPRSPAAPGGRDFDDELEAAFQVYLDDLQEPKPDQASPPAAGNARHAGSTSMSAASHSQHDTMTARDSDADDDEELAILEARLEVLRRRRARRHQAREPVNNQAVSMGYAEVEHDATVAASRWQPLGAFVAGSSAADE